jgi:hypothetical protein
MTPATTEDIAEVLGDHVNESIIERIAAVGASIDEIGEAIDDLDYERRYGESREASSSRVDEVRTILEELPAPAAEELDSDADEEHEGLTIVDADELAHDVS